MMKAIFNPIRNTYKHTKLVTKVYNNNINNNILLKTLSTTSAAIKESSNNNTEIDISDVVSELYSALKPREIVNSLNNYIVGQEDAKKAVAISLRNRWRRKQLDNSIRNEIIPKNILMIGPTGCGKTEIARRIAKLSQAPFIKVEATKFTEVGFHGKDVDSIIRDLVDISILITKKNLKTKLRSKAKILTEEKILSLLIGLHCDDITKESIREELRNGSIDNNIVEIDIPINKNDTNNNNAIPVDLTNPNLFNDVFKVVNNNTKNKKKELKKLTIAEARPIIEEMECEKLLEDYDIPKEAIAAVEESGIVFIDEIDKIVSSSDYRGADASSEGVQRDLLPLIEGSSISTKHGNVNTDYILFIASGAFHSAKPSDLLAELQGRLPIRVTLKGLTEDDMYRILTEPVTNLITQQVELLKTENVNLIFTNEAIKEIARVAYITNKTVENIGARRLHTIIERVMEDISYNASDNNGETITITDNYVKEKISDMLISSDLRKYIL